jgi:hypothetical protein
MLTLCELHCCCCGAVAAVAVAADVADGVDVLLY